MLVVQYEQMNRSLYSCQSAGNIVNLLLALLKAMEVKQLSVFSEANYDLKSRLSPPVDFFYIGGTCIVKLQTNIFAIRHYIKNSIFLER